MVAKEKKRKQSYSMNKVRSKQLDEYIIRNWHKALYFEKLLVQSLVGKVSSIQHRIDNYSLDTKLCMLTALNKRFCLLIFDNDKDVEYTDVKKVFSYYVSKKINYESEEARKKIDMFIIDQRQVAKHFFAGTYRFSEPLYKMAKDGTQYQFISEFKTPHISISQSERTERNFDVYSMLFRMIEKGYYIDTFLLPLGFTFGHFTILAKLFRSERVLTKEELLKKNKFNMTLRTAPNDRMLKGMVDDGYVERHDFKDKDENGYVVHIHERPYQVYTLSPKGIRVYIEITNAMMNDIND